MGETKDNSVLDNSSGYLNRLEALFKACAENSIDLKVSNWFHTLLALYRELSTEMSQEELNECKEFRDKINPKIQIHITRCNKGVYDVKPDLYDDLNSFELFLRDVTKKSGLQQKLKENFWTKIKEKF